MIVVIDETGIGGPGGRFPTTRWSAVVVLQNPADARRDMAVDLLVQAYWKPVYKHLRIRWNKSNEDAKDLTQGFFAQAFEKEYFKRFDPARGARFRTYLRTCLDGFVANEEKAQRRQKRGGGQTMLAIDFDIAESELALSSPLPDECFDREFARSLFSAALEDLRAHCEETGRADRYLVFLKIDIERDAAQKVTYSEAAAELGLPVTTVTNHLAYARRTFRKLVLERLRAITGSDEEFRTEARRLLGGAAL